MSTSLLKLIAMFCMLIDHVNTGLLPGLLVTEWGMDPELYRGLSTLLCGVGRMAFPIFAFFVAEGCRHTHSFPRYLSRLLIFAFVSELPFRLAFQLAERTPEGTPYLSFWPPRAENVFFTLFLGALSCFLCKALREKRHTALAMLPVVPLSLLAEALSTDYAMLGVLMVFAVYALPTKESRFLCLGLGLFFLYPYIPLRMGAAHLFWTYPYAPTVYSLFAALSLALLWRYNGQSGKRRKWLFYVFYPAHLLAVFLLRELLVPSQSLAALFIHP